MADGSSGRRFFAAFAIAAAIGVALIALKSCGDETPSAPRIEASSAPAADEAAVALKRKSRHDSAPPSSKEPPAAETPRAPPAAATPKLVVRVEDRRTGAPIADAELMVDGTFVGKAGADGTCAFDARRPIVRVAAKSKDYEDGEAFARSDAPATIRLAPICRMRGVVRNPDGTPAAKARVYVAPMSLDLAEMRGRWPNWPTTERRDGQTTATADEAGRYSIAIPRLRRFRIAAEGGGGVSEVVDEPAIGLDAADVMQDFALRPYGRLVVHVKTADGAPAEHLRLMRMAGSVVDTITGDAKHDGAPVAGLGTMTLRCPPGPTTFGVSGDGRFFAVWRRVEVQAGETVETTIDLGDSTPQIAGRIIDDTGRAVADASILVRVDPNASVDFSTKSDANGLFRLTVADDGEIAATVYADGHVSTTAKISTGVESRIVLRRAAMLTFRAIANGVAQSRRSVRVLLDDDPNSLSSHDDGASGVIRCDSAKDGDVQIRICLNNSPVVARRVHLDAGRVTDLGDVEIPFGKPLKGRVVDPEGRPIAGAQISLDESMEFIAGLDGTFTAKWAPPDGLARIRVSAMGFLTTRVDVDPAKPVVVALARGGLVWGEAVDGAGEPVADVTIRVLDDAGGELANVDSDRCGLFEARATPGRRRVRAEGCDDVVLDLVEGGEQHVRLVVRR